MNALIKELEIDPSTPLTDSLAKGIEIFGTKETIDCLISAVELRQEKLPDESKEYRDLQMIHNSLEAVSHAAEVLTGSETHVNDAMEFKKTIEQQKRRTILAEMLLDIGHIKVM